jgi:hypothetical protein
MVPKIPIKLQKKMNSKNPSKEIMKIDKLIAKV